MKRKLIHLMCMAFLAIPMLGYAQTPELFEPFSERDEKMIRAENDYSLQRLLYGSKRHRIVQVDIDILRSGKPFTMNLFDDEVFVVQPDTVETKKGGLYFVMKGHFANPELTVNELMSEFRSEEEARQVFDAFFGIKLIVGLYRHEAETNANFSFLPRLRSASGELLVPNPSDDPSLFYGVRGTIDSPTSAKMFSLAPLEMGGARHVVLEIDPEQIITPGPEDDPNDPEMGLKRKASREFIESLGEDPRLAIIRSRREEPQ